MPSLLLELISLLREQNSLMRELIQFHTRRPAQTPSDLSKMRFNPGVLGETRPQRQYTADDVFVASREAREDLLLKEHASRQAPWRHPMETLADLDRRQEQRTLHPTNWRGPSDDAPAPLPKTSPPGVPPAKA